MRGSCGGRAASGLEGWALASGDHTLASAGMALPETPGSWQGAGVAGSGEPSPSSPEGPRPLTAGPGPPHVPEQTIGLGTGARRGCGAFGGGGLRLCPQGSLSPPARQGPRGWRSPGFHPSSRCHLPARPQRVTWRVLGPYAAATCQPGRPRRSLLPGLLLPLVGGSARVHFAEEGFLYCDVGIKSLSCSTEWLVLSRRR